MEQIHQNTEASPQTPQGPKKVNMWLAIAIFASLAVIIISVGVFIYNKKSDDSGPKRFDYSQTKTTKDKDTIVKDDSDDVDDVSDDTGQDDNDNNDTDPGDDPVQPITDPVDPGVAVAFPGAEGPGTETAGGRGGEVIKVTNLDEKGPGSLRAALETSGPRIVVFETGGTIDLGGGKITIDDPYLTIAGQTAPGDGIQIKDGHIIVATHDVVIRGMRFRVGDESGEYTHRGVTIQGTNAYNVVLDHNSVSWGRGGNFYVFNGAHDVTFSWNIVSEALLVDGSKGLTQHKTAGENIASHHNIMISNAIRNPQTKSLSNEVINNYVYNYGQSGTNVWLPPGSTANVINNMYVPGPDTPSGNKFGGGILKGITVSFEENPRTGELGTAPGTLYLSGNIGEGRSQVNSTSLSEEWQAVFDENGATDTVLTDDRFGWSNITVYDADDLYNLLFASDGAGAIVPARDAVDVRTLAGVQSNTGKIIWSQDEVGGWDTLAAGTAPQDSDDDGMPDSWEEAYGTNPNIADDDGDLDSDGYTNIEEYINSFFD